MTPFLAKLFWAVLPSLLVAIVLYFFNGLMHKHEDEAIERAELRKKETMLLLQLQMAIGQLTYAVAMAIKRGKANGEVEEGIKVYETARKNFYKFVNETHVKFMERETEE